MRTILRLSTLVLFCCQCALLSVAQEGEGHMVYLQTVRSDNEVAAIKSTAPLFISEGKVYRMAPECMNRRSGSGIDDRDRANGANDRAANSGVNDRQAGNGIDDRQSGAGSNARHAGDGVNDRATGKGMNDRKSGKGRNKRQKGGGRNDRSKGNGIDDFTCYLDGQENVVIYFYNMKPDKSCKIYYNGRFLYAQNKQFKIKKG